MVSHACNNSTRRTEAGALRWFEDSRGQQSELEQNLGYTMSWKPGVLGQRRLSSVRLAKNTA